MYDVAYTGLEEDHYVDYAVKHPSQFLHKTSVTSPINVRKEIFETFKGDLSFSAYVRIFESIGVINWPIRCGMVGADLAVYYRVAARLLKVSETELLDMLERERLTPQGWVPIHHYEKRGVVFVSCPSLSESGVGHVPRCTGTFLHSAPPWRVSHTLCCAGTDAGVERTIQEL